MRYIHMYIFVEILHAQINLGKFDISKKQWDRFSFGINKQSPIDLLQ